MRLKINGRIILGIAIPLLVLGILAGLGLTYRSGTAHTSGNPIVMPWDGQINLEGTDYFLYFFTSVREAYIHYPWVVQISYLIVLLCILGVALLLILMARDIVRRKKEARMLRTLQTKYYEPLLQIAHADHKLTPDEISQILQPERITETSYAYRMKWIELFILLRADTDLQEPSVSNIQQSMSLLGLNEFMENRLIYGRDSEKLRVIQAARLLNMQLPDSVMSGIVNNRNTRLQKAARLYYILINKDDPYLFFDNNSMHEPLSVWDQLELHQLFADCHHAGKRLPSFIPLIRQLSQPETAAFFIRETAFWGSEPEVAHLEEYFNAPEQSFRRAAFEGMGLRRFAPAEEQMKACFWNQSETLRRVILESILRIRSGESVDFLRTAFLESSSRLTKRTALMCLWHYGPDGQQAFREIRQTAAPDEQVIFAQIEQDLTSNPESPLLS